MSSPDYAQDFPDPAALVCNGDARAPILLLCDHASNAIPEAFDRLGLRPDQLESHIAFDPGASPLTVAMAETLGAAYVLCRYSRLLIDVNREPSAPDSIVAESDGVPIPGNGALSEASRAARVAHIYEAYHETVDATLTARLQAHGPQAVVSVHSFTPRIAGNERPWDIGIVFNRDRRLARTLVGELVGFGEGHRLTVGLNEPYSPDDRVYHSLERHAEARGLPCVMIEVRNDELGTPAGQKWWADCLGRALLNIVPSFVQNDGAARRASR